MDPDIKQEDKNDNKINKKKIMKVTGTTIIFMVKTIFGSIIDIKHSLYNL